MPIMPLSPAGQTGFVLDINPAELVPTAWTAGKNVQFVNGAALSVRDSTVLTTGLDTQPNWCLPTPLTPAGLASWLVASPTKLYAYVAGALTDITRLVGGDYTGASANRWTGGVLAGVTVCNNGTDVPQAWLSADPSVEMVDLPDWQSTVRVASLRSFKQYLVGLDVTKSGQKYPTLVKWSHPADPGAVPASWDETDPTKDAGEFPLSETPGACIDCLPLRDINIIYKTDSVWGMQYVGGTYIFKFFKIFGEFGMPARDCAVEYQSGKHFVFTGDDLKVHDGQTVMSVATGKVRKLLRNFTIEQLRGAYVMLERNNQEVWFCFRMAGDGESAADTALTWAWDDGSFGLRDLNNYRFMANGRMDPPVTGIIDWTVAGTWEEHPEEWGEATVIPSSIRTIGLGSLQIDWIGASAHTTAEAKLERTYLGIPLRSNTPPDLSTQKFLRRLWPRITGTEGDVVYITMGSADSVMKPIVWKEPKQFVIGVDEHVDVTVTGKMFGLRITSVDTGIWTFNGLEADVQKQGEN